MQADPTAHHEARISAPVFFLGMALAVIARGVALLLVGWGSLQNVTLDTIGVQLLADVRKAFESAKNLAKARRLALTCVALSGASRVWFPRLTLAIRWGYRNFERLNRTSRPHLHQAFLRSDDFS